MKPTDFAECLTTFLSSYLPGLRNASENTIKSYRDTFKLVLIFAEQKLAIPVQKLTFAKFNPSFVESFLDWLKTDRSNSIATHNQRLAAIHAFIRYVQLKKPEYLYQNLKILDISMLKQPQPELAYLTPESMQAILAQPDMNKKFGRRDVVLLGLMYDTGARVQEIADLRVRDIRLNKPNVVALTGKGNKTRITPISTKHTENLRAYLIEHRLTTPDKLDFPLFFNHQKTKMTRAGITYILKKYSDLARANNPSIPKTISPHILRHSKAMHMLQAGINLIYIRDFLGHAHVTTTEIYAKADPEMKRFALEKSQIKIETDFSDWAEDKSLMSFLTDLCSQ